MKIKKFKLIGVILTFLLASIWHFIYDWFPNLLTAIVFPVNESPWEHVKLLFLPAIIIYCYEYYKYGKGYKNFVFAHTISIILMPIMMFILFYGYQVFIEESLIIDILITLIVIALGSFIALKLMLLDKNFDRFTKISYITLVLIFLLYSIITFFPPKLDLFLDSNTMEYGIKKSS